MPEKCNYLAVYDVKRKKFRCQITNQVQDLLHCLLSELTFIYTTSAYSFRSLADLFPLPPFVNSDIYETQSTSIQRRLNNKEFLFFQSCYSVSDEGYSTSTILYLGDAFGTGKLDLC